MAPIAGRGSQNQKGCMHGLLCAAFLEELNLEVWRFIGAQHSHRFGPVALRCETMSLLCFSCDLSFFISPILAGQEERNIEGNVASDP